MKILAVGDIHLGRTPARLPDELVERARALGPAEAWRRTVELARRERVRAVLLAGDVVDRDDDFFEAYGALERGVRRLADAGIEVIGVAGNHDVEVLPKLARELPAFRLLGAGGRWEAVVLGTGADRGGDGDAGRGGAGGDRDGAGGEVRGDDGDDGDGGDGGDDGRVGAEDERGGADDDGDGADGEVRGGDGRGGRDVVGDGGRVVADDAGNGDYGADDGRDVADDCDAAALRSVAAGRDDDGAGDATSGLTVWGWSFPQRQVFDSPVAMLPGTRGRGLSFGLLHCDRDASGGPYAPVASRELALAGLDGWLLGHIHAPDALTEDSPNGYLGSLSGLHRGETGVRGPWLIEIAGGRIASVEQVPLAPLRWERIDVDLTGIDAAADAKGRVLAALRAYDANLVREQTRWTGTRGPEAIGAALRLCGRSRFGAVAADAVRTEGAGEIFTGEGGAHYFVADIEIDTRPEIDLATLARRSDPPGLLAARLMLFDMPAGESPERDALVARTRDRLRAEAQGARWQGLGQPLTPSDEDAVAWLRKAGWRALDALLAQSPDENRSVG